MFEDEDIYCMCVMIILVVRNGIVVHCSTPLILNTPKISSEKWNSCTLALVSNTPKINGKKEKNKHSIIVG